MRRIPILLAMSMMAAGASAQSQPTAPTSPVMVFFDWGKGEVRRDDEALLDKVAQDWRARPATHLRLTGYTDRSGDALFNRRAGMERAATVRSELEKRGVPRNAMTIASFGEERPLVATENGVREVQNRRVEISFGE